MARNQSDGRDLVLQAPTLPMPIEASKELGYTANQWKALSEAVWPAAKTVDGIMLGLLYCHARKLDPFKRPVHIVPMYNAKLQREVETVWPGIGELRTTASRTGVWAGNDDCQFGPVRKKAFRAERRGQSRSGEPYANSAQCPEIEYPEWAQFTVYRIVAGVRVPFVGPKVRFDETFSGTKGLRVPNERWQQAPFQMLEKCAEAAALRRAFPEEIGNEMTAEEMEGQVIRADAPAEAKYHFVSADEADGGGGVDNQVVDQTQNDAGDGADDDQQRQQESDPADQQHGGGDDAARDLNGWNERALERFMGTMEGFCRDVDSVEALEQAISDERDKLNSLPVREKRMSRKWIGEAQRRLGATPQQQQASDQQQDQGGGDQQQESREQPRDHAAPPTEDPGEDPPFIRNFRRRVEECEFIADVIQLEKNEERAIDQQPGWVGKACAAILEERKAALRGDQQGGN